MEGEIRMTPLNNRWTDGPVQLRIYIAGNLDY
jgi:hypothetical protein